MTRPEDIPEDVWEMARDEAYTSGQVQPIARALLAYGQRRADEERGKAAREASEWLTNWAHDLSETHEAYSDATQTGQFNGKKIDRVIAKHFATQFRERSEAVAGCAEPVATAIRSQK